MFHHAHAIISATIQDQEYASIAENGRSQNSGHTGQKDPSLAASADIGAFDKSVDLKGNTVIAGRNDEGLYIPTGSLANWRPESRRETDERNGAIPRSTNASPLRIDLMRS